MNNLNSNIRRIDELGRIVIPKDIRKKLKINENEPLEIYIDIDTIIIKKYSELPKEIKTIKNLIDIGNRITGNKYIITDRTYILTSTEKELENIAISKSLESIVLSGLETKNKKEEINITDYKRIVGYFNIASILIEGNRSGVIIEYNENQEIKNDEIIKIFKSIIENEFNNG